jgi:hypothetical protein
VVYADGRGVLAAAVHDAMHHRSGRPSAGLRDDGRAHVLQCGVVRLRGVEDRGPVGGEPCLLEHRALAADAFDLTRPDGLGAAAASQAASNNANLMLDDPQLSTRIGSLAGRGEHVAPCAPARPLGRGCFTVLG